MSRNQKFMNLRAWAQLLWAEPPLPAPTWKHTSPKGTAAVQWHCAKAQGASVYAVQLLRQRPLPHHRQSCTASAWHADPSCSLPQTSL